MPSDLISYCKDRQDSDNQQVKVRPALPLTQIDTRPLYFVVDYVTQTIFVTSRKWFFRMESSQLEVTIVTSSTEYLPSRQTGARGLALEWAQRHIFDKDGARGADFGRWRTGGGVVHR